MKHQLATRIVMVLAFTATVIAFSAFRQKDSTDEKYSFREETTEYEDTTTPRKRNGIENGQLDDKIEKAMDNLDRQMKQLDLQMKKIDFSKMQKDIDASLSKIDFDKIGREIDVAIKKIDWDKIESEMSDTIKKVKKLEMNKVKLDMEKARAQITKQREAMKLQDGKVRLQVEKAMEQAWENMKDARKNMEKAREELNAMREFTDELEKDGLIDKKKGYRIEIKNNELYLNDKQQPKEVTEKYRKYFKKDNYTIISEGTGRARI